MKITELLEILQKVGKEFPDADVKIDIEGWDEDIEKVDLNQLPKEISIKPY